MASNSATTRTSTKTTIRRTPGTEMLRQQAPGWP